MKAVFDELMSGLDDVEAFLSGQNAAFRVHAPEAVDVKHIRKCLNMTQQKFSGTFGFSLDAIKNWETGRRKPEAAARTLLTVIHKNPMAVLSAISTRPAERKQRGGSRLFVTNRNVRRAAKRKSA